MNAKLRRQAFAPKTNRKKSSWFNLLSPNRTFYLTFVLSILFHVGLLYSIPAVDLFSSQTSAENEKMIVLDLLDDESLDLSDELALSDEQEHQFQAAVPDIPWNLNEELRESEPKGDVEEPEFAQSPKIAELKNEYTLHSDSFQQKPDLQEVLANKRDPKLLAQADSERNLPTFPRRLQMPEERLKPRLAEKKLTRPALDERAGPDRTLREIPMGRREMAERQDRQLGLARENAEHKNRFGIFAGEKFDMPLSQNTESVPEADKKASENPDDATQKADTLQAEDEIEGPVKGRAIVYRPRAPQIGSIDIEVGLRLRFWVLPDGTIGEVIPIKRGNAQLEQIAIRYLKKWRFEPLRADAPQKKIWGTIPIKFTAQ